MLSGTYIRYIYFTTDKAFTVKDLHSCLLILLRLSPLFDNFKNIVKTKLFEQYHLDNLNTK